MKSLLSHTFLRLYYWTWILLNNAYSYLFLKLGYYQTIIDIQNRYIKQLERLDCHQASHIAKCYIWAARSHYCKGELLLVVEKCLIAINNYKYKKYKVYELCFKAYRILLINCPDFNNRFFWEKEIQKEKLLLK